MVPLENQKKLREHSKKTKKPAPAQWAGAGCCNTQLMSGLVVGVPLIRQRLTVSTVTQSLVGDVVHVLREKLD